MQVLNRKILPNVPFEDYLKIPAMSHSGIRNDGVIVGNPSKKMHIGKQVHAYLLTPKEYDYQDHDIVYPIAIELKRKLGKLLYLMEPELTVTADFEHEGFLLSYKGRGDLVAVKRVVVDIKVSDMPAAKSIPHFGYDNQITGYCKAFDAPVGILVSISPKTKVISIHNMKLSTLWWEAQIKQRGKIV